MAYGHAERTLACIRQLEAETTQLLRSVPQLDQEQSAWLGETDPEDRPGHDPAPSAFGDSRITWTS
jgi:hypothetical protein